MVILGGGYRVGEGTHQFRVSGPNPIVFRGCWKEARVIDLDMVAQADDVEARALEFGNHLQDSFELGAVDLEALETLRGMHHE
jgi:hypothetical protein